MADNSKIEWTDATWNPIVGCSHASRGCDHCYAERMAWRLAQMGQEKYQAVAAGEAADNPALDVDDLTYRGVWKGKTFFDESVLDEPIGWKKRRKIFVCSMGDLFHQSVPFEWVDQVMAVVAACCQWHTFQILTKRPQRMLEYFQSRTAIDDSDRVDRMPQWYQLLTKWLDEGIGGTLGNSWDRCHDAASTIDLRRPLPNLWLGVTAEDQKAADERIPLLLQCQAAVRFVSVEPMLGPVDITPWLGPVHADAIGADWRREDVPAIQMGESVFPAADSHPWHDGLNWVICGGETGPGSRPMHPAWVLSLRDQCKAAGVPFFFKSWGDWQPISQMQPNGDDDLYHPAPANNPEAVRKCKVATSVLQLDGTVKNEWPVGAMQVFRVGKKAAGNLINGVQWHELPREVNHD